MDWAPARKLADERGFHSGTIIDDGKSFNLVEVEKVGDKAVAQNRTFKTMNDAIKAFGHGPETGKDFQVTVQSTSQIKLVVPVDAVANNLVDKFKTKGYKYAGMYPGKGEANCHAFTHYTAEVLRIPHTEKADRSSGMYRMNFGWERGREIYNEIFGGR